MIKYSIALLMLALTACGKEDAFPLKVTCTLVNASPDAPALNLFIDNNPYDMPALSFPGHSHLELNAGKRNLKLGLTATAPLVDTTLFIVENRDYSLYIIDALDSIETVFKRDTLTLPATDKAKIRFIHLSPDAPAVSFNAHSGINTLSLSNQRYKNFPAFAEVDARNYKIGFSINNDGGPVYLPDSIALASGKIYTFLLQGFSAAPAGNAQALRLSIIENN